MKNLPQRVHVYCACCRTDDASPHVEVVSPWISSESFRVVRCRNCGLLYIDPRPPDSALLTYYPSTYSNYDFSAPRQFLPDCLGNRSAFRVRLKELLIHRLYGYPLREPLPGPWLLLTPLLGPLSHWLTHLPIYVPGGRILEVGCSTGHYLSLLRELGWKVHGVEFQPEAARFARMTLGLDVFTGSLEEARLPDAAFDAAVLFQVIEHLPYPGETLNELRRLLKPGASIYVGTPNFAALESRLFGRFWWAWEVPRHLHHFTPGTLGRLLENSGFCVEETTCEPLNNGRDIALSLRNAASICGLSALERFLGIGFESAFRALYAPMGLLLASFGLGTRIVIRAVKR